MRLITLAIILLALLVAAPASAADQYVPGSWQARSLNLANDFWGDPCGGRATVDFAVTDDPYYRGALGWADAAECVVHVNLYREGVEGYAPFCTIVLHEMGHLAGFDHSSDPNSIMRPVMIFTSGKVHRHGRWITRWGGVDPRCQPSHRRRNSGPVTGSSYA